MKKCTICKIHKNLIEFGIDNSRTDKLSFKCKPCQKIISKKYRERTYEDNYAKNKEKIIAEVKKYYEKNKASILAKSKERYNKADKKELNKRKLEYHHKKKNEDPCYKLRFILRNRQRSALRKNRPGHFLRDLGCTVEDLRTHIESLFKPGMTWKNWGMKGWHLDHIIPLAEFDLTVREQFLIACHYTNLQPLWSTENLKKAKRGHKIS